MTNHNVSFIKKKIERVQRNACLVITGTVKGTSRECLYHELELEENCVSFTKS